MADAIPLPGARTRLHYRLIQNPLGPLVFRLMGGWRVTGQEHIPQEGPALICSNHVSYLDPPVLGIASPRRCCYMARASLFVNPLLGWFIRKSYAYPVDRDEGGRQGIRIGTTLLEAGELVIMFPEGTRSLTGDLQAGQPGAAFIASRVGAPVVPAAVWGTDVIMPPKSKGIRRSPVYVRFGEPLRLPDPAGGGRLSREDLQEFTDVLMSHIAQLQAEVEQQVPGKWVDRAHRLREQRRAAYGQADTA